PAMEMAETASATPLPASETPSPAITQVSPTPVKVGREVSNGEQGRASDLPDSDPPATSREPEPVIATGKASDFLDSGTEGWEPLVVTKSAEELEELRYEQALSKTKGRGVMSDNRPPASRDTLRLGLGLGYVQGADFGWNVSAQGGVKGVQVSADTLLTQGKDGFKFYNGRVSLRDPSQKWGVDLGDLGTEIWGARRGVRYSWKQGENRWPWISLYLPGNTLGKSGLTFAYGDEIRVGRNGLVAGEVASNGSYFLRSHLQPGNRVSLFGYTRGGPLKGYGLLANVRMGREVNLYGSLSRNSSRFNRLDQQTLGIRMPLIRGVDLTLENSRTRTEGDRSTLNSVMLGAPVGPFRLYTRYEWGGRRISSDLGPDFLFPELRSRNWTAILLFPSSRRLHFDYQMRRYWNGNGSAQSWNQVMATYKVNPKTNFQVISGFPDVTNPDQFRLRVDREINRDLSVKLDYGRMTPYQSTTRVRQRQGFTFFVTKQFGVSTPVKGGTLKGRVLDQAGQPVPHIVVRCGPYSTPTDTEGRYAIRHLPGGSYTVSLDEGSLPADYQAKEIKREIKVRAKKTHELDFQVIPLSTVSGTVYEDKNANGRPDPDEGVPGAVVQMDGFVTATDKTGQYAFYNVAPGPHRVELDGGRLSKDRMPAGPTESSVHLHPGKPVTGVDFAVKQRQKDILFQDMAEE
ncbi:MAG: carboxypeptidase regulatory-like domain-containing protein, partial [Armatimonadetes bacterium]|nr:carboxypeptidase regulatory-like domain-containing protein [Armatimonadota bacterium]